MFLVNVMVVEMMVLVNVHHLILHCHLVILQQDLKGSGAEPGDSGDSSVENYQVLI